MPYQYRSPGMRETARRGRRAMMLHPDWRTRSREHDPDWFAYGADLIADILHGLNSRTEIMEFVRREQVGASAILASALNTYQGDFDEERDY